jgi:hypothetical protein
MHLTRCLLTEDYDKTRYEIETPLTSTIDYNQVRAELHIPTYVDSSSYLMERGIVTIWAAMNAGRISNLGPTAGRLKIKNEPMPVLLFGGGAVKMLCQDANLPTSPLCRDIDDIDLIASRKRAQDLYKLLLALGDICGTRYYHFVTRTDRRFNAMRAGKRYRVRAIDRILNENSLKPGTLDIFTDEIDLRHKLDVRNAFDDPEENVYTIGIENVLMAKCQYIFDVPKSAHKQFVEQGLEYRILDYRPYRSDRLLIGIEEKDIKDICSIFISHDVGEGGDSVNPDKIRRVMEKDKKFALTFRLNLESFLRNEKFLKSLGLTDSSSERITSRVADVLQAIPEVDKKWSNPWWNVDVETPQIFGKVANE